jgi:hypothetical protein
MPELSTELQTLLQTFMAEHVLSHSEAERALAGITQHFGRNPGDVKTCIIAINQQIECVGLKIKTVKPRGDDGSEEEFFHGFVVTANDHITKEHGSELLPWQLELYRKSVELMVER